MLVVGDVCVFGTLWERVSYLVIMQSRLFVFCFLSASLFSVFLRTVRAEEDEEKKPRGAVEGHVYMLDAKSFHAFLSKAEYLCVLFVASDCGECQTMAEEFKQAAKDVAIDGTPLRMGQVMVKPHSAEEKLAVSYGITGQKFSPGFPTIYLFKNGEMSNYYNWGVNEKSLVKAGAIEDWLTEQAPWRPTPPDATNGWKEFEKAAEEKAAKKAAEFEKAKKAAKSPVIEEKEGDAWKEKRRLSKDGDAVPSLLVV